MQSVKKKKDTRYDAKRPDKKVFQRIITGLLTILIAFFILQKGALPKKYRLAIGDKSAFDIIAPRDIENRQMTEKLARMAAEEVAPAMKRIESVPLEIMNLAGEFIYEIRNSRQNIFKRLQEQNITRLSNDYEGVLYSEQEKEIVRLGINLKRFNIPLSDDHINMLVTTVDDYEIDRFDKLTRDLIGTVMKEEVNSDNLESNILFMQKKYQESGLDFGLPDIGSLLAKVFLKPNSMIDQDMTDRKKTEAYDNAMENKQIIPEGTRIVSYGDIITEDKLEVLKELNLLETDKPDYLFAGGMLIIVICLAFLLILYLRYFCTKLMKGSKELILLGVIIILDLIAAWLINPFSPLLIPIFIAPMLISILLDLRLAIVVNFLLIPAALFITGGDQTVLYVSVIGGTFAAFIVTKGNQRSKLSAAGLVIAVLSAAVAASIGLINKSSLSTLASNAMFVAVNGMLSTILTIGILPFFEIAFNIVTPLKLLELSNPNQPLMKKLLMEAPGTYHHSLMVGNLAEAAAEAIDGDALLARVGAYYHDVGKLKRPNYFKENQLSDNPHDRMSPNLSALVITSHTGDGVELAEKYKIPAAVRDIILQHHGSTLVVYFYHKANKDNENGEVKQEDFRYNDPKPASKEAAVVMLADSAEAAIRSMTERTEEKIDGLIRKIIKDKLEDGQLDYCELTLKDLDKIAKAFTKVFGGYFHEREIYPESEEIAVQSKFDYSEKEMLYSSQTIPESLTRGG